VPSELPASWFAEKPAAPPASERHIIGIVGRVTQEKGSRALARAAMFCLKQDANADLMMIGDGGRLEAFRYTAAAQGLTQRVTCTGFVANRAVGAHLDRLDVLVNAPDADMQCFVLLEAQDRGVPVIASDVPVSSSMKRQKGLPSILLETGMD